MKKVKMMKWCPTRKFERPSLARSVSLSDAESGEDCTPAEPALYNCYTTAAHLGIAADSEVVPH